MINHKSYLLIVGLLILSGMLYSCQSQKQANVKAGNDIYASQYSQKWDQVYNYILRNWGKTAVQSKKLPKPFLPAMGTKPIFFYWDNYFIDAGVLETDSLAHYAKNAVDDAVFLVNKFGFVPNANRAWGENRTQTPYLSLMVRDVYDHMAKKDTVWLMKAYKALRKEYHFWTDSTGKVIEDHTTSIPDLQHFGQHATKPELIDFYNKVLVKRLGLDSTLTDNKKAKIAAPYVAEAEVMDFTPRFNHHVPEFAAVDLNSMLYLYEKNFAWMEKILGIKNNINWNEKAKERKKQIQKYLWDENRGLFMDYNYKTKQFGKIPCISSVYPLFAGIATKSQAQKFVDNLSLFEYKYGITVCKQKQHPITYQWDYPAGWPPIQLLTIKALDRYGYKKQALRVAVKYLDVATKNFFNPIPQESGHNLYEKYTSLMDTSMGLNMGSINSGAGLQAFMCGVIIMLEGIL